MAIGDPFLCIAPPGNRIGDLGFIADEFPDSLNGLSDPRGSLSDSLNEVSDPLYELSDPLYDPSDPLCEVSDPVEEAPDQHFTFSGPIMSPKVSQGVAKSGGKPSSDLLRIPAGILEISPGSRSGSDDHPGNLVIKTIRPRQWVAEIAEARGKAYPSGTPFRVRILRTPGPGVVVATAPRPRATVRDPCRDQE